MLLIRLHPSSFLDEPSYAADVLALRLEPGHRTNLSTCGPFMFGAYSTFFFSLLFLNLKLKPSH